MPDLVLSPWPRRLHPGVSYSTWPQLKFTRARQLVDELMSRIEVHSHMVPRLLDPQLSADRLTVTFSTRRSPQASLEEWSLILGDALHNYRSALDALTWELANLGDIRPTEQMARRIYFPICTSEAAFQEAARTTLRSVPKDLLSRLWAVQPFHSEPVEDGIAIVLQDLDIADKHRGLLRLEMRSVEPDVLSYRLIDDEGHGINEHEFDLLAPPTDDRPVYPVFRLHCPRPIAFAEAPMGLPLILEVAWHGRRLNLLEVLALVDRQVLATFEVVNTGRLTESGPSDSE